MPGANSHAPSSVNPGSPLVVQQVKEPVSAAVALVEAVVRVQSLAWEFLHVAGVAKKKKKKGYTSLFEGNWCVIAKQNWHYLRPLCPTRDPNQNCRQGLRGLFLGDIRHQATCVLRTPTPSPWSFALIGH